jgi:hypothetical protein
MMVSQSNDIEVRRADGEVKLSIAVHDIASRKLVGYLEPMVLYGSEIQLRGGRFHAYDTTVRDYPVTTSFHKSHSWNRAFTNMVEWIADAAHGRWSFFMLAKGDWDVTFYFDDPQDAMLFRLSIN